MGLKAESSKIKYLIFFNLEENFIEPLASFWTCDYRMHALTFKIVPSAFKCVCVNVNSKLCLDT